VVFPKLPVCSSVLLMVSAKWYRIDLCEDGEESLAHNWRSVLTFTIRKGIVLLILKNRSADSMRAGSPWVQQNVQKMVTDF